KKRLQRDESLRVEMTLSKEEAELIKQVKDSISHILPSANIKDGLVHLAKAHIKKTETKVIAKMAVKNRAYVPRPVRREVLQEQKCCQWRTNGEICGSTFQLQTDHRQSLWAGGTSEKANLQLLCAFHNRLKYKQEAGIQTK